MTVVDSFVRDGPLNEGLGGYGTGTWVSSGDYYGGRSGDSAYRILATGR